METAIFSQVIDIPISYIMNGLVTLLIGGVVWQFKTIMTRMDASDAKLNTMQIDITEMKAWMKFKDKEDYREREE